MKLQQIASVGSLRTIPGHHTNKLRLAYKAFFMPEARFVQQILIFMGWKWRIRGRQRRKRGRITVFISAGRICAMFAVLSLGWVFGHPGVVPNA